MRPKILIHFHVQAMMPDDRAITLEVTLHFGRRNYRRKCLSGWHMFSAVRRSSHFIGSRGMTKPTRRQRIFTRSGIQTSREFQNAGKTSLFLGCVGLVHQAPSSARRHARFCSGSQMHFHTVERRNPLANPILRPKLPGQPPMICAPSSGHRPSQSHRCVPRACRAPRAIE